MVKWAEVHGVDDFEMLKNIVWALDNFYRDQVEEDKANEKANDQESDALARLAAKKAAKKR